MLVFMGTTRSTGSVDQVWPKQTEHGKHRTNAQIRIFVISTFFLSDNAFSWGNSHVRAGVRHDFNHEMELKGEWENALGDVTIDHDMAPLLSKLGLRSAP